MALGIQDTLTALGDFKIINTDQQGNRSAVPGESTTDALDWLNENALSDFVRRATVVNTHEELAEAKEQTGLAEAFERFDRLSHRGGVAVDPVTGAGSGAGLPLDTLWRYEAGSDSISQDVNTDQLVMLVSRQSYSTYLHRIRLDAETPDDDDMGVVAAANIVEAGTEENTLTIMVWADVDEGSGPSTPDSSTNAPVARVFYNRQQVSEWQIGDDHFWVDEGLYPNTWGESGGFLVEVDRTPDEVTVRLGQPGAQEIDPASEFTIDLTSDPRLEQFQQALPYGYATHSVPNATFSERSFSGREGYIYDLSQGEDAPRLWTYQGGAWQLSDADFYDVAEPPVLLLYERTGKSFYVQEEPEDVFLFAGSGRHGTGGAGLVQMVMQEDQDVYNFPTTLTWSDAPRRFDINAEMELVPAQRLLMQGERTYDHTFQVAFEYAPGDTGVLYNTKTDFDPHTLLVADGELRYYHHSARHSTTLTPGGHVATLSVDGGYPDEGFWDLWLDGTKIASGEGSSPWRSAALGSLRSGADAWTGAEPTYRWKSGALARDTTPPTLDSLADSTTEPAPSSILRCLTASTYAVRAQADAGLRIAVDGSPPSPVIPSRSSQERYLTLAAGQEITVQATGGNVSPERALWEVRRVG